MKKKKSMIGLILVLAVLFIGIGYAAITNVTLTITGSAQVEPGQENFNVHFPYDSTTPANNKITGTPSSGFTINNSNTYAEYTALTTATIAAPEFTKKDQYVDFTFQVKNDSSELSATIASSDIALPAATTYFEATLVNFSDLTIAANGTGSFTVRVKCLKTPATTQSWSNFTITITAHPAEA